CLPFVLAVLAVKGLRAVGAIAAAPPGPVGGGSLTVCSGAVAILIGLGVLIAAGLVVRWRFGRHLWTAAREVPAADEGSAPIPAPNGRARGRRVPAADDPGSHGAAAAFLLVLCTVALVIWVENPFAAALLVPALHCWLWIVAPETRLRTP